MPYTTIVEEIALMPQTHDARRATHYVSRSRVNCCTTTGTTCTPNPEQIEIDLSLTELEHYGRPTCNKTRSTCRDEICTYDGPCKDTLTALQRATSLHRRAQDNAPAASCWLRRVLDTTGAESRRVHRERGAGSVACNAPMHRCVVFHTGFV